MKAARQVPATTTIGMDHRAFLADALAASAAAQAEQAFTDLCGLMSGGGTPDHLAAHIEMRGTALMDLWADLMTCTGQNRQVWARDAALGAVRAYAGRLGELMAAATEGGRG